MDIRIKKYLPNFSQSIWMGLFIIIIPLLIGVAQYGYYAKLYAIPSILAELFFSYQLSSSQKGELFNYGSLKNPLIKFINYLNIIVISLLFLRLCGFKLIIQTNLLASLAIFNSLILKNRIVFLFHRIRKETILRDATIFEGINISFYIISFLFFFILIKNNLVNNNYLFLVPCLIISMSGTIIFYYSQNSVKGIFSRNLDFKVGFKEEYKNSNDFLKIFFFRSYENTFISIMPLLLYESFGAIVAGEGRIAIAILKGISKIFPHRYDLFIYRKLNNKKYINEFFKDAKNFIINFLLLFFLLIFAIKFIDINIFQEIYKNYILSSWGLLILTSPFFAVLASITPYLNKLNLKFNLIWLIPLILSYSIGFMFNSLNLLIFLFLLSNLFILLIVRKKLKTFLLAE